MEEVRSLVSRRVKAEFVPQRTADDLLALAFEWLTRTHESLRVTDDSVQVERDQDGLPISSLQEVMR
jgi:hypothetical protein